jgi:hypothetical protein
MSRDASGGGRIMNSILYGNFRIEILTWWTAAYR